MFRKIIILAVLAAVLLTSVLPAAAQSAASSQCAMFHTVQRGDTLSKLARTFNVTVAQLTSWNSIANANRIYAGQMLCVGRHAEPHREPLWCRYQGAGPHQQPA